MKPPMLDEESSRLLANPAWVVYLHPFCFIVPDEEEPWEVSLDEINTNAYDHGRLSRIVARLPTPLGPEWPMFICYDGGLAIPRTSLFTLKEEAIEYFNTTLCNVLLGGIVCEAIDTSVTRRFEPGDWRQNPPGHLLIG